MVLENVHKKEGSIEMQSSGMWSNCSAVLVAQIWIIVTWKYVEL
jgi:hypothetical protein